LTNEKWGAAVRSYLLHSSLAGVDVSALFTGLTKVSKYTGEKPEPNWSMLTSLSLILMCGVTYQEPCTSLTKLNEYPHEKPFS
jgi:hypothetical protein